MKKLVFAIVAVMSIAAFAAETKELTDAEKQAKQAEMKQRALQRSGGIVEKVGTGRIVIVNCQKKIPVDQISADAAKFNKLIRATLDVVEGGAWQMGTPIPANANAAVFIVDDASLPISLIAPEARWGVLNVSAIDAGPRFDKAFARTAIATFGGGVSQYKSSPMQPVFGPADLDKVIGDSVTFDAQACVLTNLKQLGVTQSKKTTYRKACEEGWAAQPTNDYQKAIWKEVHQLPTEPLKLTK